MKKIILILLIFCFSLPVFSSENEYYLGEKYRKEITKTIDKEYPKAIKAIDNVFIEFEKEKRMLDKELILEYGISEVIYKFYGKLVNITNKYLNYLLVLPETDWEGDLIILVSPYLKNNDINMNKINNLNNYADRKRAELEKKY